MTTKNELMSAGFAAGAASRIGFDIPPSVALTAAGSTQATAYVPIGNVNVFGTVASSTGMILPLPDGKGVWFVVNNGSNTLTVYPNVGGNINNGTANAGVSVPAGKSAIMIGCSTFWLSIISA